jgi:hypothetical protein
MSNSHKKKQLPPTPPSDVLGRLADEPYDGGLKVNQPSATPAEPAAPRAPINPLEAAPDDTLKLPRGALVAMRRSGGFKFRSRTMVVYRDGRVNYDDGESGPRTVWTLGDAEMAELRSALAQAGFARLPVAGRQNPDAFAYEIVARPSRRVYSVEAFQGSIPASLAPLIKQLNRLAGMDGSS